MYIKALQLMSGISLLLTSSIYAATTIFPSPQHNQEDVSIRSDSSGNLVSVWISRTGETPVIQAAVKDANQISWTICSPDPISRNESSSTKRVRNPVLAVNNDGFAVCVWNTIDSSLQTVLIYATTKAAGSTEWKHLSKISVNTEQCSNNIKVSINNDNIPCITVVWTSMFLDTTISQIRSATSTDGGQTWH